jgi:hypothetical protein
MTDDTADRLALHELMGRYGDIVDARAWDRLGEIFTPDVTYDVTSIGAGVIEGLEALVAFMDRHAVHPEAHLMANVHVDELTARTGVLRARILALQPDGTVRTGAYRNDVVKTGDGWRIRRLVFTYQRRRRTG